MVSYHTFHKKGSREVSPPPENDGELRPPGTNVSHFVNFPYKLVSFGEKWSFFYDIYAL